MGNLCKITRTLALPLCLLWCIGLPLAAAPSEVVVPSAATTPKTAVTTTMLNETPTLIATAQPQNLTPALALFIDSTNTLTFDDILADSIQQRFRIHKQQSLNLGYTNSTVWMRCAFANTTPNSTWLLQLNDPNIGELVVRVALLTGSTNASHFIPLSRAWQTHELGIWQPFAERIVQHRHFLVPVDIPPNGVCVILFQARSGEPLRFTLQAWQEREFWQQNSLEMLLEGLYVGILLVVALYNGILFLMLRERRYLWFCACLAVMILLHGMTNGWAYQYLWSVAPTWNQQGRGLLNGLQYVFAVLFAQGFLGIEFRAHTLHDNGHNASSRQAFSTSTMPTVLRVCVNMGLQLAILKLLSYLDNARILGSEHIDTLVTLALVLLVAGYVFRRHTSSTPFYAVSSRLMKLDIALVLVFWAFALASDQLLGSVGTFDRVMNALVPLMSVASIVTAAVVQTRSGEPSIRRQAQVFLAAMSSFLVAVFGGIFLHIGVLPSTWFTEAIVRLGVTTSVALFSLPLGERITRLLAENRLLALQTLQAEKAATEARLEALQAKIHPHFLFNTLNSIASLIRLDAGKAERAVIQLSHLFRYVLQRSASPAQSSLVRLSEELYIVQQYVELESLRLAERLRFVLNVQGSIDDVRVPALLLQPLVENSIKYAVAPRIRGGTICLSIVAEQTHCTIRLCDDGATVQAPTGTEKSLQMDVEHISSGLANVQERLRVAFGSTAQFALSTDTGWCVEMRLPVEHEA